MCNADMHITEKNRSVKIKTASEDAIIIFRCFGVHVSVFSAIRIKRGCFSHDSQSAFEIKSVLS